MLSFPAGVLDADATKKFVYLKSAISPDVSTKVSVEGHTHSAYVNQNAYGKLKVGSTTTTADATQDTITFASDGAASVSIDGDTITISATDNDTKNTAGSTDTSSKIFLIGATSQGANPQTYSDDEIFATDGVLTTKKVQIGGTSAATIQYNNTNQCIEFVFA